MSTKHTPRVAPEEPALPARPGAVSFHAGQERAAVKMNDLEVSIGGGDVQLHQTDENGEMVTIRISPEQAELACKWIMHAAKTLLEREGIADA